MASRDVLNENFRPGTLERWGLDPEEVRRAHPELVVGRIAGFGQTGPYRSRTGLGIVAEAMGGIRYLTGHPGGPTSRTGIALADETASLFAVIGTLAGLVRRSREGRGDVVDVALYEAVFALMEAAVTEYKHTGKIREAAGSADTGVAPTNTYRTADGKDVVIGGHSDLLCPPLMRLICPEDLAAHEPYRTNPGRAAATGVPDSPGRAWD